MTDSMLLGVSVFYSSWAFLASFLVQTDSVDVSLFSLPFSVSVHMPGHVRAHVYEGQRPVMSVAPQNPFYLGFV